MLPCRLYGGNMWIPAAAGHLFGTNGTATVLANTTTYFQPPAFDGGMAASGIGGWGGSSGGELRLLVSVFTARKDVHDPATVSIVFDRPKAWGAPGTPLPSLRHRQMVLDRNTSVYDTIYEEAKVTSTLADPDDPNVYVVEKMLTAAGKVAVKAQGEKWLTMQQSLFTPPSTWSPVSACPRMDGNHSAGCSGNAHRGGGGGGGEGVGVGDGVSAGAGVGIGNVELSCSDGAFGVAQTCTVTLSVEPPFVTALWIAN